MQIKNKLITISFIIILLSCKEDIINNHDETSVGCTILTDNQICYDLNDSQNFNYQGNLNLVFQETLDWIDSNAVFSNDNYILTEEPTDYYTIELNVSQLPNNLYTNLPIQDGYYSIEQFRGQYVVINNNLQDVYVSDSTDFTIYDSLKIGDMIPNSTKWFITSISSTAIKFNYGWLYINAWYAEGLIDMYLVTGNQEYIDKAIDILLITSQYIDSDGKWYRYTAQDNSPRYISMSQAIFMRVMLKLYNLNLDNEINGVFLDFTSNYEFISHEGVYNHWSNSVIGEMIKDSILNSEDTDYERLSCRLDELYEKIDLFEGKIPYYFEENTFSETYQTYDTFLLSMMTRYSKKDINFNNYFQQCFDEAIDINYSQYFANNTLSALYIYETYCMKNDEFMEQQRSIIYNSIPEDIKSAVNKLRAIAALVKYDFY